MADLAPHPPLFWVKKQEMTEGRKASRASKSNCPPPWVCHRNPATTSFLEVRDPGNDVDPAIAINVETGLYKVMGSLIKGKFSDS